MTIEQDLKKIGFEIGKLRETLRIARNMLKNGMDPNIIMNVTGLNEDDLALLRQQFAEQDLSNSSH